MNTDVQFTESNRGFASNFGDSSQSFRAEYSGVKTIHGKDGASAYEIALKNGFVGSEVEWLESLHGKDGTDGVDGYTPVKGKDYFDGVNGKDGRDGVDGRDGYTPVKGKDYFDGKDGIDGKNGYTPVKGVDYFDGKDGANGKDGADGKTPVKGTDYFTEADKAEMVNAVKAQLIVEQWTFTLMDDTTVTKDVIVE